MSTNKRIQFGLQETGNVWTPQNYLSEIKGWWRSDLPFTLTDTNQSVNTWTNIINNSLWTMAQDGGADTPTTGFQQINGINSLSFQTNGARLASANNTTPNDDGMWTFVALMSDPDVDQAPDPIFTIVDDSGASISIAADVQGTLENQGGVRNFMGASRASGNISNNKVALSGGPYTGVTICVLDMDFNTGIVRIRMNGREVGEKSGAYNTKLNNNISCRLMTNENGQKSLKGLFGEFVVAKFTNGFTGSKTFIEETEGYLAWKYGSESKLPSDHPYKLAKPRTGSPENTAPFVALPVTQNTSAQGFQPYDGNNVSLPYSFQISDFPYSDAGGNKIDHISILSFPDGYQALAGNIQGARDCLTYNGSVVTLGQQIPCVDDPISGQRMISGSLRFVGPTPTTGAWPAVFRFSVNNGTKDSFNREFTVNVPANDGSGGGGT